MREQLNDQIEIGLAMSRLLENPDFKKIFIEGYIKSELELLVSNLARTKPESRNGIQEQLISRANFRAYCNSLIDNGIKSREELNYINEQEKEENINVDE